MDEFRNTSEAESAPGHNSTRASYGSLGWVVQNGPFGVCVAPSRVGSRGGRGAVNDVALTPDGGRALAAGTDSRIHVWDLARGTLAQTLQGHGGFEASAAPPSSAHYPSDTPHRFMRK